MKIKKISKRIISIFLTMVTVVTMLASVTLTTNAIKNYSFWGEAKIQGEASMRERQESGIDNYLILGTTGQSLRLEGFALGFVFPSDSKFVIKTYSNGKWSDQQSSRRVLVSKPFDAIKLGITGSITQDYMLIYRLHLQGSGWEKRWHTSFDDTAGDISNPRRIEAIEIGLLWKYFYPKLP